MSGGMVRCEHDRVGGLVKAFTKRFRGTALDVTVKSMTIKASGPSAAPIRASGVKRAYDIGPVALRSVAGLGLTGFRDLPRSCLIHVAVLEGSSWSARSRAAARTNEVEVGDRRRIMRSGEDSFLLRFEGRGAVAGVAGGVVWLAPIRRRAGARRHDHVSGDPAGQSDDRARRWPARAARASSPGAW
jgi:hypothetical protein